MKTMMLNGPNGKKKLITTAALSLVVLTALVTVSSLVAAQSGDFAITANPGTLCVNPGINGRSVISVSSLGGFSGTINLGANLSPSISGGPILSSIPSTVDLASGQSVSFNLDVSTNSATPTFVYTVTVSGLSGSDFHSGPFSLVVSNDCSVGGVTVPTGAEASTGSSLALGIAIAGIVAIAAAGLAFYVRKSRNSPDHVPLQKSVL